jgi:hypothetical protein
MNVKAIAIFSSTVALLVGPVLAHHSFSMFDHEKTVSLAGTLKEFEFTNPHSWLHITAMDEKTGRPVEWSLEMGSASQVTAQGWKPDLVKPGDKITVEMHPLKDGSRGGQYLSATLADGRSFKNAGAPNNNNVTR